MSEDPAAPRAREFLHEWQAAVCDLADPWPHGTVLRATRYPDVYDLNVVRVERDAHLLSAGDLMAFADEALAGLAHRAVNLEDAEQGERVRPGFEDAGWKAERLVWMLHDSPPPPRPALDLEEVSYEQVRALREAWHLEDFPTVDPGPSLDQGEEFVELHGYTALAVIEQGEPIAFTLIDRVGSSAAVAQVYVSAERRGQDLGTALTCAAIEAAQEADDVWIVADDAGRPKHLYARLGFRPVWLESEFLRLPRAADEGGGPG